MNDFCLNQRLGQLPDKKTRPGGRKLASVERGRFPSLYILVGGPSVAMAWGLRGTQRQQPPHPLTLKVCRLGANPAVLRDADRAL